MVIEHYCRCGGEIDGERLRLTGKNIGGSKGTDIHFFRCGKGAKDAGFRPQQWVAKYQGEWYIRTPGDNGQRGNYRVREGRWETHVTKATPEQAAHLDAATASSGWFARWHAAKTS